MVQPGSSDSDDSHVQGVAVDGVAADDHAADGVAAEGVPADGVVEGVVVGPPAPPPLDDDADVVDAEIVEATPSFASSVPAADYSDSGVPSLDYLRDRIEGRYATAIGSTELAQAAADRERVRRAAAEQEAALTAEAERAARAQAVKAKLDEIRRTLGNPTP